MWSSWSAFLPVGWFRFRFSHFHRKNPFVQPTTSTHVSMESLQILHMWQWYSEHEGRWCVRMCQDSIYTHALHVLHSWKTALQLWHAYISSNSCHPQRGYSWLIMQESAHPWWQDKILEQNQNVVLHKYFIIACWFSFVTKALNQSW